MKKYLFTLLIIMFGIQAFSNTVLSDKDVVVVIQPTRVEKKEFDGISSINLIQKYGNIAIQESSSNKVTLEIQYFDSEREQAQCSVSQKGEQLLIETTKSGGRNNTVKVDYVLVVPAKINISGTLSYGNMMLGESKGTFNYTLEYANLMAKSFSGKPLIKAMYSNITINMCEDLLIEGSYNQYIIKNVRNLFLPNMRYSNANVDVIRSCEGELSYSKIAIKELKDSLITKLSYSSIKTESKTNQVSNIQIDARYSDIQVNFPQDIQAKVSLTTSYANINVAKAFDTNYALESTERFVTEKIGRIGTKTPTLNMSISNKYADINIQTIK